GRVVEEVESDVRVRQARLLLGFHRRPRGERRVPEVDVLGDGRRAAAREADVGAVEGQEAEGEGGPAVEPGGGWEIEDVLHVERGASGAILLEGDFRGEPGVHAARVEPERVAHVAGELRPSLGGREEHGYGGNRTKNRDPGAPH